MKNLVVSIIIPTYYKSSETLEIPLKSIVNQKCPKEFYEVIIADNKGGEVIKNLAKKYKTRFTEVDGKPSQVCRQINRGAKIARGEYLLLVDHDIAVDQNLIGNFVKIVRNKKLNVDAWYIPYKIIARGKLLTKIRNFEESFYQDSIIAAPRLIKKSIFAKIHFDQNVSSGAPDWDFMLQMKLLGIRFGYIKDYFYHHEEEMSFWQFISKKVIYSEGGEVYKNKWRRKNPEIYNSIVAKQYDPLYRLFGIFIENGKWKKLILGFHLYLMFLFVKGTMSLIYFRYLLTQKLKGLLPY